MLMGSCLALLLLRAALAGLVVRTYKQDLLPNQMLVDAISRRLLSLQLPSFTNTKGTFETLNTFLHHVARHLDVDVDSSSATSL